jgi:hypothetical protein
MNEIDKPEDIARFLHIDIHNWLIDKKRELEEYELSIEEISAILAETERLLVKNLSEKPLFGIVSYEGIITNDEFIDRLFNKKNQ